MHMPRVGVYLARCRTTSDTSPRRSSGWALTPPPRAIRPGPPLGFSGGPPASRARKKAPTRPVEREGRTAGRQARQQQPSKDLRAEYKRKLLKEHGLTLKDAEKLGIKLLAASGVQALGPNFEARGGMLIQYYDDHGRPIERVFRVRYLEEGTGFSSKVVKPKRYAQPRGTPPKAYLPTTVRWHEVSDNPSREVIITEGEFKAACACKLGFPTLGLGGVDAWRSRKRGISLLPELEAFQWVGRVVYLCFDSDIVSKPEVRRALHGLARELKRRGADVREVRLPALKGLEKVGADDFLLSKGREAFQQLLDQAEAAIVVDEHHLTHLTYVDWMNENAAVVQLGGSVRVLRETTDPETGQPTAVFSTRADAALFFQNKTFTDSNPKAKPAFQAWLNHPQRRTYDAVVFAPEGTDGMAGYPYNLWRGFSVTPEPGDWSRFEDHLRANVCGGDDSLYQWLLAWLASLVQRPHRKVGNALVLVGRKGVGKSKVGEEVGSLFHPSHYAVVAQRRHLLGNFNAHLRAKIVVQADEAFWAGDQQAEGVLKDLITSETMNLELKGVDVVQVRNLARLIITSNEQWVVPASWDERRFAVFAVRDDRAQDTKYFGAMEKQMAEGGRAGLLFDLLSLDLAEYPGPRRIPRTAGLGEQKLQTLDAFEQFWFDSLMNCQVGLEEVWPLQIACKELRVHYLEAKREGRRPGPEDERAIGKRLRSLCPDYRRERATVHGGRCWVYKLPRLDRCREAFEHHLDISIDWETGEAR